MDLDIVKLDPGLENRSDKIWLPANLSAVCADRLDNSCHCYSNVIGKRKKKVSGAYKIKQQKNMWLMCVLI